MIKIRVQKPMKTPQGMRLLKADLQIEKGEFVTFFGESGAGKTTLLRMIAGLTLPQEGSIEVDGEVWFDSQRQWNLPVQERQVGFVFQEYSLFPHMTIRQNLQYALADKNQEQGIEEWLTMMDLKGLEDQRPEQISGGQKQAVALARALLRRPRILLLDEPLSAVDLNLRLRLQDEIVKIYQKAKITTILVSHDASEVFKLSGKIFVIKEGTIVQSGDPNEILVNNRLSGKFKFAGEIVAIDQDGVVNILTVQIGNTTAKVVATDEEAGRLKIGSRIVVAAKAFNPLIWECGM